MGDSFQLQNQRMCDVDEAELCNMSWTESNEENNSFSDANDSCNKLKRRFQADSGYFSITTKSSHPVPSCTIEEDYLAVEKENEFLENEDFQKLITGPIIKANEEENFLSRKKIRIFHQEAFEDKVKGALDKLDQDIELIGDFSRPYTLPTVPGKHQDLKSISANTLCDVITGKYNQQIDSYLLLDSRFPYEFSGGHIEGSENIYTRSQIDSLLAKAINEDDKENTVPTSKKIIIFHCEFSSERAPKLARYLRAKDREFNSAHYPKLHYPEIYILDGGYKDYYKNFSSFCNPQEYLPMLHPDYTEELRHFRAKSKSETNARQPKNRRAVKIKSSQF